MEDGGEEEEGKEMRVLEENGERWEGRVQSTNFPSQGGQTGFLSFQTLSDCLGETPSSVKQPDVPIELLYGNIRLVLVMVVRRAFTVRVPWVLYGLVTVLFSIFDQVPPQKPWDSS